MLGEDPLLSGGVPLAHIHVESIFMSVQTVSCGHMLQYVGLHKRGGMSLLQSDNRLLLYFIL